ncbi:MAG: hypothetical protein AB8G14_18740 [Ilumatobacter sp.]
MPGWRHELGVRVTDRSVGASTFAAPSSTAATRRCGCIGSTATATAAPTTDDDDATITVTFKSVVVDGHH